MKNLRIVLVVCLIVLGTSLAGCSKKDHSVKVLNGVIITDGNTIGVTEYRGGSASTVIDGVGTVEYYLCNTYDHCEHNTANVLVEDMSTYKKCKYYTLYHETNIYLYVPFGKKYIECFMKMDDVALMSTDAALKLMYDEANKLYLNSEIKKINYEDIVTVNVTDWEFKLRSNELIIPQYFRIKKDDGSVVTKETATINDVTLGKMTSNKYDYYQGKGVIIQVPIGTDISNLIIFK